MFYTALWRGKDERAFRESMPLEYLSESIRRYDSTMKLSLVILEGYEFFSADYKKKIDNLGFVVIDYSPRFADIVRRFPHINKNYSQFERNCFLRWIAFKEILRSQNGRQFWHLDADMVLYASLDEIAADTKGKTFAMQGTPTLMSISDFAWFDTYERELKKLDENIADYSNHAAAEKPQCRVLDRKLGNYSVYRNPVSSDQDLIEYLIGCRKLPQDSLDVVYKNSKFYYVQNILEFLDWDEFQGNLKQYPVEMDDNYSISIGNRRVPFIHYTDSFVLYVNIFLIFYRLKLYKNPLFRHFLYFRIDETKVRLCPISLFLYRMMGWMKRGLTRTEVIRLSMKPVKNSNKIPLLEIINYINAYYPSQKVGIFSENISRSIGQKVKKLIDNQMFYTSPASIFFNPFYFARKGLRQHITALAPYLSGRILDVGCGSKPYRKYFNVSEYLGLEMEGRGKLADRLYDGKKIPFKDGEFDSVFTSQVLEHVFNPEEFLPEINRVLKDEGVLLLTVPFIWDEHEQPFDYARYSSFGLRHLLEIHGFEVIEHRKSMADIRAIFQMVNAYIYKKTNTRNSKLNLIFTLTLMAPFNLLGEFFARIFPGNNDLYLDNIVLARKKSVHT